MVTVLLGVFVGVAVSRIGPSSLTNSRSEANARRLAMDVLQARRRAIATGDNHYLEFVRDAGGSGKRGYAVYRGGDSRATRLTEFRTIDDSVSMKLSDPKWEFEFSGSALATYRAGFGGTRAWIVEVIPTTGAVSVYEN